MPLEMIVDLRVLADVDHLRAGIGLLAIVRHRDRVELADRVVALEDAARILPGDRGAGLDLRPGDLRVASQTLSALGDEVVDAALAVLVAGVPVLDGRVLDLRVLESDELDDRRVELVLVADRRRATLEVAHVRAFVRDDQRPLELPRVGGVDSKIGRELHRTANALGDVAEGAVGEDRGVERREEVVGVGDDGAEVLLDELGVVLHRLGERAEDDADLGELLAERGRDGNRVEDGVDGDARRASPAREAGSRASRRSRAASGRPPRGSWERPRVSWAPSSRRSIDSRSADSGRWPRSAPSS